VDSQCTYLIVLQFTTIKNKNNYNFCTNNKLKISVQINCLLAELKLNLR